MRYFIFLIVIWTTFTSAQMADRTLPSPTTTTEVSNRISQTIPVASPTHIEASTKPNQYTSESPTQEATPTTTSSRSRTPVISIIVLTAPRTPLPPSATSLVIDTHDLSSGAQKPSNPDKSGASTTSREQTATSGRTTTSARVVSATDVDSTASGDVQNGANSVRVGGEVAASACALIVAIAAMTWAFADFD
jgi:hypothetical protein